MDCAPLLTNTTASKQACVGETSPAYKALTHMLETRYRIHNSDDLELVPPNSSYAANNLMRAASLAFCCLGPCVCYPCCVSEAKVAAGNVRRMEDGRGNFFLLGPGMHRFMDPYVKIVGDDIPLTDAEIRHGDRTIVVVEQGYVGYAVDKGQPVLLPPGLHQWRSDTLEYKNCVDLNRNLLKLGPMTLVTVDENYAAVTQDNGKQVILNGGQTHLLTHRNWKFEKFISLKFQTNTLDQIEATTADNVLLLVDSTVCWYIQDVDAAARMLADTMKKDGSDSHGSEDITKLRHDVLQQATASMAQFIGTVDYSSSFHLSAANHAPPPGSKAGNLPGYEESPPKERLDSLFNADRVETAVTHCNKVTSAYGVNIMSINIISAKPKDRDLLTSLAQGAVAAAEAEKAEVAARGQARATQIDAQAQTLAEITICLLYTSDAADEEDSVDLGGWRINKKKQKNDITKRR
eukprot:TRINITY_DN17005_c0_g1_i3.p1 TRINITY_DN17005_c0_g1~~TRINITY_DN17005_c0_g1_i3.p1  ORF type:complete len:463 (-),score=100.46 TRINITY_DN17005_c0_g1_i3:24-1412(-)